MRIRSTKRLQLLQLTAAVLLMGWAIADAAAKQPNILVIWGDDIGTSNISHNNRGMMGYHTPGPVQLLRSKS